jgi:hypothetical protein
VSFDHDQTPAGTYPPSSMATTPRLLQGQVATVSFVERLTAIERLRQLNPLVADGLLAAAVFAFTIVGTVLWVRADPHAGSILDRVHLLEVVLVVAACAPLAWRRRAPITTLALTTIATVAYVAAGHHKAGVLATSWPSPRTNAA